MAYIRNPKNNTGDNIIFMGQAANLIENIKNSSICDELIKYLAPYFHLSQKQIKSIEQKSDIDLSDENSDDEDENQNASMIHIKTLSVLMLRLRRNATIASSRSLRSRTG